MGVPSSGASARVDTLPVAKGEQMLAAPFDARDVREGMDVESADGRPVGRVVDCRADVFVVERGCLFRDRYDFSLADVAVVRSEVHLRDTLDEVNRRTRAEPRRAQSRGAARTRPARTRAAVDERRTAEDREKADGWSEPSSVGRADSAEIE